MARVVWASASDCPDILFFIRKLAEYEKLLHEVSATEESLRATLFGPKPPAEVIFLEHEGRKAGFALFFTSYSTFLGKPGIYLEDLFVLPEFRSHGFGGQLLGFLAKLALERGCGRLEWSVLDWNEPAIGFYKKLGAEPRDGWTVYRMTGDPLAALASRAP